PVPNDVLDEHLVRDLVPAADPAAPLHEVRLVHLPRVKATGRAAVPNKVEAVGGKYASTTFVTAADKVGVRPAPALLAESDMLEKCALPSQCSTRHQRCRCIAWRMP